ncbi:MAG: hypothetical protein LBU27_07960 [Candidatus Peribacteria bacterium]|jgi:hypothetical protein|nr:hypothetical protein [Candidatus Peribacteria bacterium]
MVGLPHQSEMKYFSQLQAQGYAYQILKYEAEELIVMDTFEGLQPLKYDPTCLVYREKSEKSKADENVRFTAFLTELSRLIQKYLPPFS